MAKVGKPVKVLWRLGLHVRIGAGQLPDPAEIVAAFNAKHPVAAFVESLRGRKSAHAAADHGDSLAFRHDLDLLLPVPRSGLVGRRQEVDFVQSR